MDFFKEFFINKVGEKHLWEKVGSFVRNKWEYDSDESESEDDFTCLVECGGCKLGFFNDYFDEVECENCCGELCENCLKEVKDYYTHFNNFNSQSNDKNLFKIDRKDLNARDEWSYIIITHAPYEVMI